MKLKSSGKGRKVTHNDDGTPYNSLSEKCLIFSFKIPKLNKQKNLIGRIKIYKFGLCRLCYKLISEIVNMTSSCGLCRMHKKAYIQFSLSYDD